MLQEPIHVPTDMQRPRTSVDAHRTSLAELKVIQDENNLFPWDEYPTPKVRRDCLTAKRAGDGLPDGMNAERPCPWCRCKYHLAVEVNAVSGSVKENFPDVDFDQLKETCALDVADKGGVTLEEIGDLANITRERIRQVEAVAMAKMAESGLLQKP